jgi:hypothetical protein
MTFVRGRIYPRIILRPKHLGKLIKFFLSHRVLNPRLSDLSHIASTTALKTEEEHEDSQPRLTCDPVNCNHLNIVRFEVSRR